MPLFFPRIFDYECRVGHRTNFLSIFTATLWLSCPGCVEPVVQVKMSGSVTVTVDAAKKQTSGKALLGNEVIVVLPPPKPAGYIWQITVHNARYLRQRSEITPVAGGTGESKVSFVAIQIGTTKLRFALVESSTQAEINPVDIQEVALAID